MTEEETVEETEDLIQEYSGPTSYGVPVTESHGQTVLHLMPHELLETVTLLKEEGLPKRGHSGTHFERGLSAELPPLAPRATRLATTSGLGGRPHARLVCTLRCRCFIGEACA